MFNPFKKREKKPTPPWMMWLMVAVLIFAIFSDHKEKNGEPTSIAKNVEEKTSAAIEDYKQLIFPGGGSLQMRDVKDGEGNPAICGQEATITLDGETKTFRIGDKGTPEYMSKALIGVRVGGERKLLVPTGMLADPKPEKPQEMRLALTSLSPALPDFKTLFFRISDTTMTGGLPLLCGDRARVLVTLWDMRGKKLVEKKEVTFAIGASEVFLGLEQGVIGMNQGASRSLIVPPPFLKTMRGNTPAIDFLLPKGETVLVDVEALQ